MATARTARIISAAPAGPQGRALELELVDSERLGFTGGQYLIVNTGAVREDGRAHKRAYSIVSSDEEQRVFKLCVYRLPNGPGSSILNDASVGSSFEFSGPWGNFLPDDSTPRNTLIVATDTGVTAALGLLHGRAFAPQRSCARLLWVAPPELGFTAPGWVEAQAESLGVSFERATCPPPGAPGREDVLRELTLEAVRAHRPERIYLAGDGAALGALRLSLVGEGLDAGHLRMETFFNHPSRKAAA